MSLFKIFRGPEERLNDQPLHEGYAWFTEDKYNLYIDISDEPGGRVPVNAYAAQILRKEDLESGEVTEIDIDDILLKTIAVTVAQGGTGRDSLDKGAVLVGNGTDNVDLLAGVGALFADNDKIPKFGTLPVEFGGTGGATADVARTNLGVYSKKETDDRVAQATSLAYSTTLTVSAWTGNAENGYTQTYTNTDLSCGKYHDVPPLVTCTANRDEYNKLDEDRCDATPGQGIVFWSSERPSADIPIIVIDVK